MKVIKPHLEYFLVLILLCLLLLLIVKFLSGKSERNNTSRKFALVVDILYSHHFSVWQWIDIVRRNCKLVTNLEN